MTTVSVKTQRRLHDGDPDDEYSGHRDDPMEYGFDFWCVAHGERKDCHDGMSDGSCNPDCPDCPVRCPWCQGKAAIEFAIEEALR